MKKWKPFSKWTIEEVEQEFGVVEQPQEYALLTSWLTQIELASPEISPWLPQLQAQLLKNIYTWNEEELRVKFIGPLLAQVNFDHEAYQSFFEREISVRYKNDILSGTVDFVVAQGLRSPQAPYFFLHEHKREANSSDDPRGQLLVAMVAAQILNQNAQPVYGVYIIGRAWFFVILHGKEYAVSLAYDATKDEIYQLFGILQHTRQIIDEIVQQKRSPNL